MVTDHYTPCQDKVNTFFDLTTNKFYGIVY